MKRRFRRPDDGRFMPKDAKLWRRLIKHARYAVRAPLADTTQLFKAAEGCGKAVPPPGYGHRHSIFLQLIGVARGFGRLASADRYDKAIDLNQFAEACDQALNAPPPNAAPPRADIFG